MDIYSYHEGEGYKKRGLRPLQITPNKRLPILWWGNNSRHVGGSFRGASPSKEIISPLFERVDAKGE